MASEPVGVNLPVHFAEGYEVDLRLRRLLHGGRALKLERIPFEVLLLLLEHRGEIVTRDQIASRVWGDGVFLDTDNSVRGAIRKLRQVLKDDAETPRFIQTVTGQGYRFIAQVTTCADTSAPSKSDPSVVAVNDRDVEAKSDSLRETRGLPGLEPDHDRTAAQTDAGFDRRRQKRPVLRRIVVGTLTLLSMACLLSFLAVWGWRRAPSPTKSQDKVVLAVLPFDNLSRDPEQEFFSDGLTEEMIAQIGKLNRHQLSVVARSSVAGYKGSQLAAKEIGKRLNADYLVEGSVRRWSDRVRITVQLIQAQNQTEIWTESYDRELKDLLAVQDNVVQSIATEIHIALTEEEKTRLATPRQIKPEAYEAYLKGRYHWNKRTAEGMRKAELYFRQAIDKDSTYAAAYSGLADSNSGLAWHGFKSPADALPTAHAAAQKAVEIDPQSAEAHASLALVLSHSWDWAGAEAEFRHAIELDPKDANAHHWYGDYLSIMRRHGEAFAEAKRALELDPLNLMIGTWVALRYYQARDYTRTIEQARNSIELESNFAAAHLLLGEGYVQAGLYSEGVSELKTAADLSGGNPLYTAQLAVALAAAGQKREALQIAHRLETISKMRYVSPYGLAQIYAALGKDEDTFKWLQAAYRDRAVWMEYLAVDPVFDPYRSEPRFQELLRHIDLL